MKSSSTGFKRPTARHRFSSSASAPAAWDSTSPPATHVFHFDRWWNPAVENQATDRAYRIGQTRTVLVHKYLVRGTLEERIDEMIEQKTELAENIIGAGESWLTELDTNDLRALLSLRDDAIGDEA